MMGLFSSIFNQYGNKLCQGIETHIHYKEENISVNISIGISSLSPTIDMESRILISQADKALYEAKIAGRNCMRSFTESQILKVSNNKD